MTLTKYDHEKGCFVLNPANFIVNAFHPDYIKTHEPDLMKDFRTHLANREEREEKKLRVRKTPLKMVTKTMQIRTKKPILTKAEQSKSMEEVRLELAKKKLLMLSNREFKYFSAAGANNVKPKGKK